MKKWISLLIILLVFSISSFAVAEDLNDPADDPSRWTFGPPHEPSLVRLASIGDDLYAFMSPGFSGGDEAAAAGACAYDLCEDFEGAGYENGACGASPCWSETIQSGDTVDEDYTDAPLVGSQSLRLVSSADVGDKSQAEFTFSAQANIYAYFIMHVVAGPSATEDYRSIFKPDPASGIFFNNGTFDEPLGFHDGSFRWSVNSFAAATTYHVWFEYEKGTGANAVLKLYVNTAASSKGVIEIDISNGTDTDSVTGFHFQVEREMEIKFDKLRISYSGAIGVNPS